MKIYQFSSHSYNSFIFVTNAAILIHEIFLGCKSRTLNLENFPLNEDACSKNAFFLSLLYNSHYERLVERLCPQNVK